MTSRLLKLFRIKALLYSREVKALNTTVLVIPGTRNMPTNRVLVPGNACTQTSINVLSLL